MLENPLTSLVGPSNVFFPSIIHREFKRFQLHYVYSILFHSAPTIARPRFVCLQIDLAPRLATLLSRRVHHRTNTWLGMFGAASPKPVKLLSDDAFVTHLYRTNSCAIRQFSV